MSIRTANQATLTRLVLWETPNHYVEYEGR